MRARALALLLLGSCSTEVPPAPSVALRSDGAADLRLPPVALEGLSFRLRADGRWYAAKDFAAPTTREEGRTTTITYGGGPARVRLAFTLPAGDGPVVIAPEVTASGQELGLQALELVVPPGGVRLPGLDRELRFLQHGYQSWSFTGVLRLQAPFEAQGGKAALRGGLGDPVLARQGVGWWFGLLAAGADEPSLVAGAVTARRHRTAILPSLPSAGKAGLTVRIGTADERVPVKAGASLALEPVALATAARAADALERYVEEVGRRHQALRSEQVADPTGWWSWNVFFDEVTEQQVLQHAELVRSKLKQHGYTMIELDDGYEQLWGEWEQTDPQRFPSGLAGLSAKVRAKGLELGLWLAPFLVDKRAALAGAHPEWFVRGSDGKPLEHTQLGVDGTMLVLDPTHPGAAGHLRALFGRLAKLGFTLFKLDFLYAAALPGARHDKASTGVEALGRGLELIRKAAPKAHINLCGMPFLPAVGRGHSLRYGTDIAFSVTKPGLGQLAHEARNVMLRAFFDPLIRNDPDQVLVRSPLSLDEARLAATLGAMTGFFTSGDDLTALPAERLQLLTHAGLLAVAGESRSAVPLDLLDAADDHLYPSPVLDPGLWSNQPRTKVPERYYLAHDDGGAHLALFNWSTKAKTYKIDLQALGHADAAVTELWSKQRLPGGATISVTVKPHAAALLRIAP